MNSIAVSRKELTIAVSYIFDRAREHKTAAAAAKRKYENTGIIAWDKIQDRHLKEAHKMDSLYKEIKEMQVTISEDLLYKINSCGFNFSNQEAQ